MALEIPIEHESGAIAMYHKIADATFDCRYDELTIVLHGYPSQGAADEGRPPLVATLVRVPFKTLTGDVRTFLYPIVKDAIGSPFFEAQDKIDVADEADVPVVPSVILADVQRPPSVAPKPTDPPLPP